MLRLPSPNLNVPSGMIGVSASRNATSSGASTAISL